MLCPDASTNLGPSLQCDLKKIQSQKSSLKFLEKKTYAAGKLASAKTISSPWPILAKVWSKSGDKMTGIPFKRPIFFNAENSCFSAGVFIFAFATQWLLTNSRNLPIRSLDPCLFHNSQQRQKVNMNIRSRITCLLWIFFNFTVTCYFLFILPISGPILSVDG